MGLFDKLTKKMVDQAMEMAEAMTGAVGDPAQITDGIDGIGTVAQVPVIEDRASTYMQPVAMVIDVPGMEPYAARPTTEFPHDKIPHKGQRLPVRVSASDPMKIAVLWDQVKTGLDGALEQAQQPPSGDDIVGELERLNRLRESGAISDDESAALKGRLLGT